ncbi:MAG: hypothetical protein C7B45_03190 [Sulfobacillus acidophilus]|uniref:Uncharacterized protein n=1 Tax=Sulfobacillus acidophilus TaxID=53633 RepID=A0A2T2WM67_9FIRM|nr:MAG: hypothetical protein C7B45_03190 [Sulfobacillus acidophilus]
MEEQRTVTAIVDAWPYGIEDIERAVYAAINVADRVVVVVPDILSRLDKDDLADAPTDVVRAPFWGNFVTLRNQMMDSVRTDWILLLFGNEEFRAADAARVRAVLSQRSGAFRLIVATGDRGQTLAEPVRLLPNSRNIHFTGSIWPQLAGSLIEFSYAIKTVDAHIDRREDRSSTAQATKRLRDELTQLARDEENWRARLALAVLLRAEHQLQKAKSWLDQMPQVLPRDGKQLANGLRVLLWLDQGQGEKAWRLVQEVLAEEPDRADMWYLGGEALMLLRRYVDAATAFSRAAAKDETALPYLDPGFASYAATLRWAQAEIACGNRSVGVARLLNLLDEYPGYRAAWQAVLAYLGSMSPEDVFATMTTVVVPSKIRQFFSRLQYPTPDERRIQQWLQSSRD